MEEKKPHIDVARVCELAHFDICAEEMTEFQAQLDNILAYVNKLDELNLEGIEPTMYGQPVVNSFREDVVTPSLPREDVLRNAPDSANDEIKVPKIVE